MKLRIYLITIAITFFSFALTLTNCKPTKENWVMVNTRIYDVDTTRFRVSYKKSEKEFSAKAWIEDSGFSAEFRFELIDNKWYLVYAQDQNL